MMDYFVTDTLVETGKTDKKRMAGILNTYGTAYLDHLEKSKREGGKENNDGV